MELDYSEIFSCFVGLLTKATPIAIFLYLSDIAIGMFLKIAFPKHYTKGDI